MAQAAIIPYLVEADGSVRLAASARDVSTLGQILPRSKRRATVDEMQSAIRRRVAKRAGALLQ
jgi:hypothetical protein